MHAISIAHGGKKTSFLNDFVWTKEEERNKILKKTTLSGDHKKSGTYAESGLWVRGRCERCRVPLP